MRLIDSSHSPAAARSVPTKDKHQDYARLAQTDRETVRRLAAILRVADALDRSHDSRVSELRCARDAQSLCLRLSSKLDCDREIDAAESKSELFEEVFGCELRSGQQ